MENKNIVNVEDYLNDLTGSSQNNLSEDIDHNNNTKNINLTCLGTGIQDLESLNIKDAGCLEKQIACIYKKDNLV